MSPQANQPRDEAVDLSDTLLKRFSEEFVLLETGNVTLNMAALVAWTVASHIQLACRHPKNTGPSRKIAEKVAREIFDQIAVTPALREVADMGWSPTYDVYVARNDVEVRRCRVCGCTDDDCSQCIERTGAPCHWVEPDLCSACAERQASRLDRKE